MKALDEVIKAYEICLNINETSCRDCPYTEFNAEGKWACSLCGECTSDALYYLKAYKNLQNSMNWLTQMEDIRKHLTNIPLTWEELRTMEGEPIWIELLYHHPEQKYEYWDIIERFDDIEGYELIDLAKTGYLYKSLLGREWKAYRRG